MTKSQFNSRLFVLLAGIIGSVFSGAVFSSPFVPWRSHFSWEDLFTVGVNNSVYLIAWLFALQGKSCDLFLIREGFATLFLAVWFLFLSFEAQGISFTNPWTVWVSFSRTILQKHHSPHSFLLLYPEIRCWTSSFFKKCLSGVTLHFFCVDADNLSISYEWSVW